ncbi:sensor histidine kinase [Blastococcus atacamensis]|uniref:sensor histidine kinase n=1 Tax=Blastococcus atacamensis TaxID=2070508 RepID=UPI000CEC268B|nr:histidine kinase [Blastococcus atacamensis]
MQRLTTSISGFAGRHAARLDVALGLLVAVFGVLSFWLTPDSVVVDQRSFDALGAGLTLLAGSAVAMRGRWPVGALVLASAAALVPLQLGYPQSVATYAPLLVLYTVAAWRPVRVSAPAAVGVYLLVGSLLIAGPVATTVTDWVNNTFMIVAVWAVGWSVRSRRAQNARREERNRAVFEAREARARATEVDERAAIAREMQDLVTHGITALTVHTAAARRMLRSDPDTAEHLLAQAERAGHEAVTEMRRIFGVLRPSDDVAHLRPQPSLADLAALVDGARADGMDVELVNRGTPVEVDPGVALTAYRVVQEALGNVRQHAGRAVARITLDWCDGSLSLGVSDDGRGSLIWSADQPPGGHGLTSLSERVRAYGGALSAGPRAGGGFVVTARLPLDRSPS